MADRAGEDGEGGELDETALNLLPKTINPDSILRATTQPPGGGRLRPSPESPPATTCRFPQRADDYTGRVVGFGPGGGEADDEGEPVVALTSYRKRGVRTTRSHVLCTWNADSS